MLSSVAPHVLWLLIQFSKVTCNSYFSCYLALLMVQLADCTGHQGMMSEESEEQ